MGDPDRKYEAGRATAEVDHKRGMTLKAMHKVATVPGDDPNWAWGYRDRLRRYMIEAKVAGDAAVLPVCEGCDSDLVVVVKSGYSCSNCGHIACTED